MSHVFATEDREALRRRLVAAARADERIASAALVGSAALGREERWSDVDLALCLAPRAAREAVIGQWTDRMYRDHEAVHHLDVEGAGALYRVFLLQNTLQVDLSFWPPEELRPFGPGFRLLFGKARAPAERVPPAATDVIGWGWLYALHARASIARGRRWQAEYMISAARDQVLTLACLRHGLPAREGRGIDQLPPEVTERLRPALVGSLEPVRLRSALTATIEALLIEAAHTDPTLAGRLADPLRELAQA